MKGRQRLAARARVAVPIRRRVSRYRPIRDQTRR